MATRKGTKSTKRGTSRTTTRRGTKTARRRTAPKRRTAAKRELIEPRKGDKRYARRNRRGQFKEMDDVGRSLSMDRKRKAKRKAPKGQGDRGDR